MNMFTRTTTDPAFAVYLGGPITGLSYGGATDWREYAADWLDDRGIVAISPMRFKNYLLGTTSIKDAYGTDQGEFVLSTQRAIVRRDRFDVERSSAILFNLLGAERVSIGTMQEFGWGDAWRKFMVTVIEPEGNVHDHAFVRENGGILVPTLDDGLEIMAAVGRTR